MLTQYITSTALHAAARAFKRKVVLILWLVLTCATSLESRAEIYRYQDQAGNWHFTDKKPEQASEKLTLKNSTTQKTLKKPFLKSSPNAGGHTLIIENPLPAPVHCLAMNKSGTPLFGIVEEYSNATAVTTDNLPNLSSKAYDIKLFSLDCIIGKPDTQERIYNYAPPFSSYKPMEVSQGFKGQFSHSEVPHLYAIDIAMPIGTQITASRAGTVIAMKNDYAFAGTNSSFFYDKANYVQIYHEDGSYATYAHMLMGKVMVEVGDTVEKGQLLGLSGTSGFSTGPHLHFVIHRNANGQVRSVPFTIEQKGETAITPEKGMWLIQTNTN
jgi:murein DD-endopeptidase MepM/ murein hydrolase activator NlpD